MALAAGYLVGSHGRGQGGGGALATDGERAVLRLARAGAWTRLLVSKATRLGRDGVSFLSVTKPASVSLAARAGGGWGGTVSAAAPARVTVNAGRRPRQLMVNGSRVKFTYEASSRAVSFDVPAGECRVEASL